MIFKPLFSIKWNTKKKMFHLTKVSTFLVFLYCEERKSVFPEKNCNIYFGRNYQINPSVRHSCTAVAHLHSLQYNTLKKTGDT